MRDLRRRALEGNKTVSRKARSQIPSQQSSVAGSQKNSKESSRANSRNPSRQVSDDEDYFSDGTAWSTNSIDDLLNSEDTGASADLWKTQLDDRMEELINRKRSTVQGREECLAVYANILLHHYANEQIESKLGELYPAILKSIKTEASEKETLLALRALSITLITSPSDTVFDAVYQILKRLITDSESIPSKTAAIHTLAVATFFGGASESGMLEIMDLFIEISESDGHSVEAPDSGSVVSAALEEWGFLATQLDDTEEVAEAAMEAFVEQLESADASVQVAAGENIALLYENSYTEQEEDEEISENDDEDDDEAGEDPNAPKMVKRYTVYRGENQLKHTLEALANVSGRGISKKDKKSLHSNFSDILNAIEYPTRGPRYSNAINHLTGKRYGSRMTVSIAQAGEMRIDKWWKLHRLQALRRTLQAGFVLHYQENEVVFDCLPVMLQKKD